MISTKSHLSKISRKTKRCQNIIERETGIKHSETPTKFLAICNAGLSNGLADETVLQEVSKFGKISDIVMLPRKSYCFMRCEDLISSECIYNALHGKCKLGQNEGVVYLSFFENLPKCKSSWDQPLPPGLIIVENFVTVDEEQCLLNMFNNKNVADSTTGCLKHRQVEHFGYEFMYDSNNVDINKPLQRIIPIECKFLWSRLKDKVPGLEWYEPDQLTVNRYQPGQGIPPHVDTHSAFLDPIISLSLESDVVIEFRKNGKIHVPVELPRRSLLIMTKESRYDWTHGITPRRLDVIKSKSNVLTVRHRERRTSFTFRRLRLGPCNCAYPNMCDTQKQSIKSQQVSSFVAPQLELENVHAVYDEIANHFSETRHSPWPRVTDFLNSFKFGSIILDIGCGNGKYLNINKNTAKIGCDRSQGLLKVCAEKNYNVFKCDCLFIPIRESSVDGCLSIAVIHHLATMERRMRAIQEMARILIPGGKALIYVWSKNQEADAKKSSYLRQNKQSNKNISSNLNCESSATNEKDTKLICDLPIHVNRTPFQQQDVLVPWKLKSQSQSNNEQTNFLRYYHVFEEHELESLCKTIPTIEIISSYYDQGNWCIIFQKL